uniref:Uncharacterized protein n=1 Tax=Anguilla anguilla TaxID=7936 RepID=A0A0E9RU35_ANGAN
MFICAICIIILNKCMNIPTLNIYVCIYAYICMCINIYIHWECRCISALIMVVFFLIGWSAGRP